MITIISDRVEIERLHKKFLDCIYQYLNIQIRCWVGFPGGNFQDTISYSQELDLWLSTELQISKYWNGFGLGQPVKGGNHSLVGEINFPLEGIDRRIAGAFAIEDNSNILVLHRGKIGGEKVGIGKHYFIDKFRGDFVIALDGDRDTKFCLVGELESTYFPNQVANFINEIRRVKNITENPMEKTLSEIADFHYTREHSGIFISERNDPVIIHRTHGLIVNALEKILNERGMQTGSDKNRDLFIHKQGIITKLFEIKTGVSTQALCSIVGQLIIYSIPIQNKLSLVAVLPGQLSKPVENKLQSLGINILYYNWENGNPIFQNLDGLL